MLFIARFDDQPEARPLRHSHQAAQDAYIKSNGKQILASGPLRRDDLGNPIGGLWYVEAPGRRSAEALCHGSPYWQEGVWRALTLLPQQAPVNAYANMRVTCL